MQPSSAFGALGFLLSIVQSQSLPYNPSNILLPSNSSLSSPQLKDVAYVFLQSESTTSNQLLSLNISSTLSASNLTLEKITSDLPFQTDGSAAFIPSISSAGEISVYAGSCSASSSAQLWVFTPSETSPASNGTWTLRTTTKADSVTSGDPPGADYLSRAFSFSTIVGANASQSQTYVFGGMCPTSGASTSLWQSAASYSNHMLRLISGDSSSYTPDVPSSRGPPIAEAGFTITGLTPTSSQGSIITQQQNFVLLGGHTQSAFINMSQVAIWSLPEEVWSFVTIDSPTENANTELAVKSTVTSVDSRSGHTAVITEDGSKIIVLGGWVGDINQAAEPQLAILELGAGFGGSGDWSWTIPTQQPSGPGIYGHGAAMLPGDIMVVLGGYTMGSSTSSKKRDATPGANAMFFNISSSTWMTEYTNPTYVAAVASASTAAEASSTAKSNEKKLGLGLGLGLGLAAILIAGLIFLWYSRRLRNIRRAEREKHIQSLSAGQASFYSPTREMGQRGGGFPWGNNGWNRNSAQQDSILDSTSAVAGYENLHAGVHGLGDNGIPPVPKQVNRKPLHSRSARGLYQPTSTFEHVRANSLGTAGPIHPIYEADEDDNILRDTEVGLAIGESSSAPTPENPKRHSDPFRDPPTQTNFSHPSLHPGRETPEAESPARSREREIQEWVSDWAAADALLNTQARSHSSVGRVSPTRRAQLIAASSVSSVCGEEDSGRTASNLSEQSVAISAMTVSRSGSSSQGRSRSNSLRGFISSAINPFSSIVSTTVASTTLSAVFDRPNQPPRSAGSGTSSFTTAHTSFPTLQAEGESLLPHPEDGWRSRSGSNSPTRSSLDPGSPSKNKPPAQRRVSSGWLGSLRKAFTGDQASGSGNTSPTNINFGARTPSPIRVSHSAGAEPRRTVSAGAMLWRRKQGRGDWDDSADLDFNTRPLSMVPRSNTFTGDVHSLAAERYTDEDEEWDIERAVENRVVQVMFTVPKEKLRVVNHDFVDDVSEDEGGELRSRHGSGKSFKVRGREEGKLVDVDAGGESHQLKEQEEVENADTRVGRDMDELATPRGKGKGKVQELVERLEERSGSPERL